MTQQLFWLMKTEPAEFSIEDLKRRPQRTEPWDGVRNYQARNFMRDHMKVGDMALLYHSGKTPAVVGVMRIVRPAYPDSTAWEPGNKHHDAKSTPEHPVWFQVDVRLEEEFAHPIPLSELRKVPELKDMMLLRKGVRLSVQPVSREEFEIIVSLGRSSRS